MAIAFARLEFVQRSVGKNVCYKAAYNSRGRIHFLGHAFQEAKTYNWAWKDATAYHNILLPFKADQKFKNTEYLWNAVEQKENRSNSQTAFEFVLALPDDIIITLDDKIALVEGFIKYHFVAKGLIAQVDIHEPERNMAISVNSDLEETNHNWHAHILITTRRLKENGLEFEDHKARDLMPEVRKGMVVLGQKWGQLWANHQNHFFEEKGYDLRVDPTGIIPQKHHGPVRMRSVNFAILNEDGYKAELNHIESSNILNVLSKITETKNIFTVDDVERFLMKHIKSDELEMVRSEFWQNDQIVQLLDPKTGNSLNKFSTKEIIEEEKQIIRLVDDIRQRQSFGINKANCYTNFASSLTNEQKDIFKDVLSDKSLCCIEGYAGTGKSYLLVALANAYESEGYTVRAFGPDHATTYVLKEKGLLNAMTLHRFLFLLHNKKINVQKNNEIWMLDECSKIGNSTIIELLKAAKLNKAQVILSGDSAQLKSIERGGVFRLICERYGAHYLEDIQRQKKHEDRLIAKNLATGEIGVAFDLIVKEGNLKWFSNKEEAKIALVKKWASDRMAFSDHSSLIIATSNKDVRELNEMVRLYRKELGELGEKDYLCESLHGKILVSQGDLIEFRKKDINLNITNGMKGTLVDVSPTKFAVILEDKNKIMEFDPNLYSSFQLGYATTNFRSQGRTLDRVYVLHSNVMNKKDFYVTLTRHTRKAYLYISKSEVKCFADLKRQAYRQRENETTLDFTTVDEVTQKSNEKMRSDYIEQLKVSDSHFNKVKGYTLQTWQNISSKVKHVSQQAQDVKMNEKFFNPVIEDVKPGSVKEFQIDEWLGKTDSSQLEITEGKNKLLDERFLSQKKYPEKDTKMQFWKTLDDSSKLNIKKYYQSCSNAAEWYGVIQAEENRNPSHVAIWKSFCIERNSQAHLLTQSFSKAILTKIFAKDSLNILENQAAKHAAIIEQKENSFENLEVKLKENFEGLVYRLFPEGPTRRNNKGLRFGAKGSFSVTCEGDKKGSFYDFEKGEGGGPLKLIQNRLNCDLTEAKSWARDFIGEKIVNVPSQYTVKPQNEGNHQWISMKPDTKTSFPNIKEIAPHLMNEYEEDMKYAYRDANGDLLFYTIRLNGINDPNKKIILPLSYGYWQGREDAQKWTLHAFQTDKRPLYRLELLKQHPEATIMIVEGEKTADAVNTIFGRDNIIALTWMGGASAVKKSDWSSLFGRQVVIWPDNDEAGYKAADDVCYMLRKVGVKQLKVVNKEILSTQFPLKWDLADPLPKDKNKKTLHDLVLFAEEKSIGIDQLNLILREDEKESFIAKLNANEILWRIEERLRPILEIKHGTKTWEIRNEIQREMFRVFSEKERFEKEFQRNFGTYELMKTLAYQAALNLAETGQIPSVEFIEESRHALKELKSYQSIQKVVGLCAHEKNELKTLLLSEHLNKLADRVVSIKYSDFDFRIPEIIDKISHPRNSQFTPIAQKIWDLK